jgi:hypothetical protein
MTTDDKIIAVGLLTQRDLDALGSDFRHVYPVDDVPCFGDLLRAIDEADLDVRTKRDQSAGKAVRR